MASNPPGPCCYQGVKHEGDPAGKCEQIDDFEAYISETPDKSTEKGILFLTDVIGHVSNNAQLVADQFAANGYFTVMPDLFYGDPVPLNNPAKLDLQEWMKGAYNEKKTPHLPPVVDTIIERTIKTMQEKFGVKKIGAAGYCFGAKYVVRFLKPGMVDVGYCAHPSFVQEEELQAIKGPLAISAAETDDIFTTEKRHRSEVILKETAQPYQINLYSGAVHGFAIRGDLNNRVFKHAKESAFLQAIDWFGEYLK